MLNDRELATLTAKMETPLMVERLCRAKAGDIAQRMHDLQKRLNHLPPLETLLSLALSLRALTPYTPNLSASLALRAETLVDDYAPAYFHRHDFAEDWSLFIEDDLQDLHDYLSVCLDSVADESPAKLALKILRDCAGEKAKGLHVSNLLGELISKQENEMEESEWSGLMKADAEFTASPSNVIPFQRR
jgi:hypothetical protein